MNLIAILFTIVAGIFLFRLRREWAALPFLAGTSYMTLGNSLDVGPFHFTVLRLLIAIGVLRVIVKGERIAGRLNTLDRLMILWGAWTVCSSCFHKDFFSGLVYRLGLAYNGLGLYFLLRVFIRDTASIKGICKVLIIVLAPVALEMIWESSSGRNWFSVLGGVSENSEIRRGKIRAQGPFAHSILAGTVGAVSLPMALLFWKKQRKLAIAGLAITGAMVVCSRSSGPMMTVMLSLFALGLWRFRKHMRLIRWIVVLGIVGLALVMNAPVYYLLDRIDLTGSSTGWHRAALIEGATTHFWDWWLGGTDYTRDWTPESGFDEDNTDITNHYIKMGVLGGLPMMLLFIGTIVAGFTAVGRAVRLSENGLDGQGFVIWTLGAVLFGHVSTMMSISYFDQSIFCLYLVLAAIGSLQTALKVKKAPSLKTSAHVLTTLTNNEGSVSYHC